MREKDITEKTLEAYNDVFADIINVLLFNGKLTVKEDELEDAIVRYHYKADQGKLHEMERDTGKTAISELPVLAMKIKQYQI